MDISTQNCQAFSAKEGSVGIQPTGDEKATLLEFTTTSVFKIEFPRPHLGAGFSISQVLLLLA